MTPIPSLHFQGEGTMSEIPEDIRKAAHDAFMQDDVRGAIERSILAEREECAKLVGSLATLYQRQSDDAQDEMERMVMFNIAEIVAACAIAIRHPRGASLPTPDMGKVA